jgi:hypothetical protein
VLDDTQPQASVRTQTYPSSTKGYQRKFGRSRMVTVPDNFDDPLPNAVAALRVPTARRWRWRQGCSFFSADKPERKQFDWVTSFSSAFDIASVGRSAVFTDPQGAVFSVLKPAQQS